MARLSRQQARAHQRAVELVDLDRPLSEDERWFVLEHYTEAAAATHGLDGAFFTPLGLARDLAVEATGSHRVIDLCAGIGRLAFQWRQLTWWSARPDRPNEIVCVERNPEYVRVGRRVLPEATWICGDVFELPHLGLDRFDCALANPPYGTVSPSGAGPRYRGSRMEYRVIDLAADLADYGVFLIPQESAPFRYSGRANYSEQRSRRYVEFEAQTGLQLEPNCGVDTSAYLDQWRDVAPVTEIVTCELKEAASRAPQLGGPPRHTPRSSPSAPSTAAAVPAAPSPLLEQLDLFAS